jgi:hypothetical protein
MNHGFSRREVLAVAAALLGSWAGRVFGASLQPPPSPPGALAAGGLGPRVASRVDGVTPYSRRVTISLYDQKGKLLSVRELPCEPTFSFSYDPSRSEPDTPGTGQGPPTSG